MNYEIKNKCYRRPVPSHGGFSVLEILLVLSILGVFCWIVIPEMTQAVGDADHQETTLENTLLSLRSRLALYKTEHLNEYPCGDLANPAIPGVFVDRLIAITNADHSSKGIFGPYLTRFPTNIFNGRNDVRYGSNPGENLAGWCFDPATGRIHADDDQSSPGGTLHCRC